TDPNGKTTSYGYDGSHYLTSVTDPLANQTKIVYDATHRVSSITRGLNSLGLCPVGATCSVTSFSYPSQLDSNCSGVTDVAGETIVTDPRSHAWTYCYDVRLRVVKAVDPDGHTTSTDYTDANGGSNC